MFEWFGNNVDVETWQQYAIEYGIKVGFAILIFVVGKFVAKLVKGLVQKSLRKSNAEEALVSFVSDIVYTLLLAFVIIAALSKLGIDTTSLAAILAAAGLAVGLALQGSLANFAAGVMLVMFRPFKVGDFVEADGVSGSVQAITIFTTTLKTPDNKVVIVPNAGITDGAITNYSAEETRRIDMVFGCGYGDDLKKARKVLEKLVAADERVLKDPAPVVAVSELADSSVNFVVRPWVKTADYWAVKFDMTEAVKVAFDKEGLSIPYPQQDVHMHTVVEDKKA